MKTMKKVIIAIALLLVVNNSMFATEPKISIIGEKSFVLSIESPLSDLKVTLTDEDSYSLYSQHLTVSNFDYRKKFDLTLLPNGTYTLEVEDVQKVITMLIVVKDDKIVSSEITKETSFKPMLIVRDENLIVAGLATDEKPIYVVISDTRNNVIHEELLTGSSENGRLYKFLYSGVYKVNLASNGNSYSHTVMVKKNAETKKQIITIEE